MCSVFCSIKSGKEAVLRLGPVNRHRIMGFEENLMKAEEYVYSVCREIDIPCSRVLVCDTSKKILDRDFMIVEYIPSVVMSNAEIEGRKKDKLYYQLGEKLYRLHQVTGESFGFVSRIQGGKSFKKWSDALIFEAEDISEKMRKAGGLSREEEADIRSVFSQNRDLLDEIRTPHLLHTDLWEGNVWRH